MASRSQNPSAQDLQGPEGSQDNFIGCAYCFRHPRSAPKFFQCSTCKTTLYCSSTCQDRDWPSHRTTCRLPSRILPKVPLPAVAPTPAVPTGPTVSTIPTNPSSSSSSSSSKPQPSPTPTPSPLMTYASLLARLPGPTASQFRSLLSIPSTYLSNPPNGPLSQTRIFDILIDAFRLRKEDEFLHQGITRGTLYAEDPKPKDTLLIRADWQRFLARAESLQPSILPEWWWLGDCREECVIRGDMIFWADLARRGEAAAAAAARNDDNDDDDGKAAELNPVKQSLLARYGNAFVMQVRVLAEIIEGPGPEGYVGCQGEDVRGEGEEDWVLGRKAWA